MSKSRDRKKKKEKKKREEEEKMNQLEKDAQESTAQSDQSDSEEEEYCDCDEKIAQMRKEHEQKIEQMLKETDQSIALMTSNCDTKLAQAKKEFDERYAAQQRILLAQKANLNERIEQEVNNAAEMAEKIAQLNKEIFDLKTQNLEEKKKLQSDLHNAQQRILQQELDLLKLQQPMSSAQAAQIDKKTVAQQIFEKAGHTSGYGLGRYEQGMPNPIQQIPGAQNPNKKTGFGQRSNSTHSSSSGTFAQQQPVHTTGPFAQQQKFVRPASTGQIEQQESAQHQIAQSSSSGQIAQHAQPQQNYLRSQSAQRHPIVKKPSERTLAITWLPNAHIENENFRQNFHFIYAQELLQKMLNMLGYNGNDLVPRGSIENIATTIAQTDEPTGREGRIFIRLSSAQNAQQIAQKLHNYYKFITFFSILKKFP